MYWVPGVLSPASATPAAPRVQPTRGPPPGSPPGPGDGGPEVILDLAEDHPRSSRARSDAVAGRLFAAGLDLQAALALMGDHPASGKIRHAVEDLDQALQDIRDTVFDQLAGGPSAR